MQYRLLRLWSSDFDIHIMYFLYKLRQIKFFNLPASNILKYKHERTVLFYRKYPDIVEDVPYDKLTRFVWALFKSLGQTFAEVYKFMNSTAMSLLASRLIISAYMENGDKT